MWCFVIYFIDVFTIFAMLSPDRCFAIAHLFEADVSPSHMFVTLSWFSISLLGVMFCHLFYWCFAIFSMILYYLLADVLPSHTCLKPMFRHHTCLFILLWFSISVRCDCFVIRFIDVSPSFPWYLVILKPMFRHRTCLLSCVISQCHC